MFYLNEYYFILLIVKGKKYPDSHREIGVRMNIVF